MVIIILFLMAYTYSVYCLLGIVASTLCFLFHFILTITCMVPSFIIPNLQVRKLNIKELSTCNCHVASQ